MLPIWLKYMRIGSREERAAASAPMMERASMAPAPSDDSEDQFELAGSSAIGSCGALRIVGQVQIQFFHDQNQPVDHLRIASFVRQVVIDLMERDESSLQSDVDNVFERCFNLIHELLPSS